MCRLRQILIVSPRFVVNGKIMGKAKGRHTSLVHTHLDITALHYLSLGGFKGDRPIASIVVVQLTK